jgi:uncharacterized coiled-coil protein SlyX
MTTDERFENIEMALTEQQRMLDDLSDVMLAHQKEIDLLKRENKLLRDLFDRETVKPLSEETPPPHY